MTRKYEKGKNQINYKFDVLFDYKATYFEDCTLLFRVAR